MCEQRLLHCVDCAPFLFFLKSSFYFYSFTISSCWLQYHAFYRLSEMPSWVLYSLNYGTYYFWSRLSMFGFSLSPFLLLVVMSCVFWVFIFSTLNVVWFLALRGSVSSLICLCLVMFGNWGRDSTLKADSGGGVGWGGVKGCWARVDLCAKSSRVLYGDLTMYILVIVIITTLLMLQKQQSTVWWSNVHTCHNHHLTYAKNSRVLYGDLMYIYVIVIIITLLEIKLDQNFHQLLWNVILGDVHSTKLKVFQITQIYTAQNSPVYIHQHFLSAHRYLQPNIDFGYLDPIFQNTRTIKVLKTVFIDASHGFGFHETLAFDPKLRGGNLTASVYTSQTIQGLVLMLMRNWGICIYISRGLGETIYIYICSWNTVTCHGTNFAPVPKTTELCVSVFCMAVWLEWGF